MKFRDLRAPLRRADFSRIFNSSNPEKYIHPAEAANMLETLPADMVVASFRRFPDKQRSRIFSYLNIDAQQKLVRELPQAQTKLLLNGISSDDRLAFFASLDKGEQTALLHYLDNKKRETTQLLLASDEDSVARLINTDFASISADMTVAQACEHLRLHHTDNETANVIYVVDANGKLIDDIPVRRLVMREPTKRIADIMDGFFVQLSMDESHESAVEKFKEYDRVALPVVDRDGKLLGVVTVDDVLDVAEREDTREIQQFGGVESLDETYMDTPLFTLLRKRAGWLTVLFVSEMLTATAMGYFDTEIAKAVVLALFVPLIISSGGNSGSQAATLIIRALALRELTVKGWWYVMRRELLSGVLLGTLLGSIGFVRIALWQRLHWYDYGPHYMLIAVTVFLSLIGIVMWGTLSGSMIPIVLKRLNVDPATSSAPFVATLVDVTGLVIYFTIASIVLRGTLL